MKPSLLLLSATLAMAVFLLAGCAAKEPAEPLEDQEAPNLAPRAAQTLVPAAPEYKAVEGTEGVLRQATLFSQKVPSLGRALEVRSVLLLPKKAALLADRDTLYEVLRGEVISEGGEARKTHSTGDLWMVSKGAKVTWKAKGEIAVLRAISLGGK